LAGLNRHNDPKVIYEKNIALSKQLINACKASEAKPHIIFSSSTQEERDNPYGKSKKEARLLFEEWAREFDASFTGLIIPNVFGPFGEPYYNSVVATFSHQLTHDEQPKIENDGELKLIYINQLAKEFMSCLENNKETVEIKSLEIPHQYTLKVSKLLSMLEGFKMNYFEKSIFPNLDDSLTLDLFNTFLCYIDFNEFYPFHLKLNTDDRGSFVETVKLHSGGQVSFSTTVPGITRGNHFHTRKAERFAVIQGKAKIELRRIDSDKVYSFELDGKQPSFVDMPIWHTHNITNIGDETLLTIFWINERFDQEDADTYFVEV
jgi:UDP-2-acetamido-2,6-beta-L-arabino-hexul-4-ose reductase